MVLGPIWHQRTRCQFRATISLLGGQRTVGDQRCHTTNRRLHRELRGASKPPHQSLASCLNFGRMRSSALLWFGCEAVRTPRYARLPVATTPIR